MKEMPSGRATCHLVLAFVGDASATDQFVRLVASPQDSITQIRASCAANTLHFETISELIRTCRSRIAMFCIKSLSNPVCRFLVHLSLEKPRREGFACVQHGRIHRFDIRPLSLIWRRFNAYRELCQLIESMNGGFRF